MAVPTIQELFGTGASLSGFTLSLDLSNFAAEGFDATDPTATRIAAALIKRWKNHSTGKEDDPTVGLVVAAPFATLQLRGAESQRGYQYAATFYVPDTASAEPDPDNVV